MNNCGCKRPAFGPEPHAPVPLHGGGFVPNAIEWLKKRIDKLFGTAVFTVNEHEPEGGNVKIVLDDLADKDGNIETTKNIMVSRDGGESHDAVALYSDLTNVIDAHNNDEVAHPELMATVAEVFATKTEVDAKADKSALQAEVDRAQTAEAQLTTKAENAQSAANAANAALANKLDKTAVVAPSASAAGKAADAKAVNDALAGKVDNVNGVIEEQLSVGKVADKTVILGGLIRRQMIGDSGAFVWFLELPQKSGTFALVSDIEDAVKDKADKATTLAGYGITDAATKTDVEAKADKSALQAEVDRAQVAEAQLTTKVENAQSAANDALSNKVDKVEGVVERSLEVINGDFHIILSRNEIVHGQIGDDVTVELPQKSGTFALVSDIEDAVKNKANELDTAKANRTELPYSLVVKEIKNGVVSLDDRADNYVDARALGSSNSLDIDFPVLVNGRSRDFVLAVECGANPPTISYAAFATIMAEDASTLAPEQGMNIYAFTEFKTNMFLVARKTVDTVVVNTPESSDQVLLAMQKRGIDTTNITDFGVVASTLGLGDDSTPQDAIDAVMN